MTKYLIIFIRRKKTSTVCSQIIAHLTYILIHVESLYVFEREISIFVIFYQLSVASQRCTSCEIKFFYCSVYLQIFSVFKCLQSNFATMLFNIQAICCFSFSIYQFLKLSQLFTKIKLIFKKKLEYYQKYLCSFKYCICYQWYKHCSRFSYLQRHWIKLACW